MDENIIIWSCNKRKYMKILAFNHGYSERLGCTSNSMWYVHIKPISWYLFSGPRAFYPRLQFHLIRRQNLNSIDVVAQVVSDMKVMIYKDLKFRNGVTESVIGICNTEGTVDYKLDLVLRFPQNTEPKSDSEEKTSISKVVDLADDFLSMLDKSHLADVILKCDSVVLKAHKNVLSARSPVFEAMFACPMEESESDTVVINDMDSSVFDAMVSFMYCGQVTITSISLACDLLYAAEKYQLKTLKEGCVDYLKSIISCENAIKILETADLYDKQLKLDAITYISDRFSDLEVTEEWQVLKSKKPALALEVYASRD